jgi:hypothetical protein
MWWCEMRKVLAVHHDADMLDLMADVLQERFPDVILECVRNARAAATQCRAQMGDPFRAVVANRSIAADSRTGRNDAEHKGLEFLESLEEFGHADVQKILISSMASNNLVSRVNSLPNCQLLLLDDSTRLVDSFVEAIGRALERSAGGGEEEEPKQVKVVVSLNLAQQLWEYEVKGVGFPYETRRTALQIDPQTLEYLVRRSRRAARNLDDWEEELLEIGHDFGKLLLYGNPPFITALSEATAKAGGPEKRSICFSIEKSVHPAVLEALTDPKEASFWMLKVPMYRRLIRSPQPSTPRPVLFKGRSRRPEPFNALIIESPVEGVVDGLRDRQGHPLRLEHLGNVTREADAVEEVLSKKARHLRRVGPASLPAGSSFNRYVQDVLHEDQWDLVHYAGHSYYDEEKGKGYLFFPGEYLEPVDIEVFNTYLDRAQTRFIYLSGCQSSEAGFVFELARLQIPAVLGFRWPIHDAPAFEFAHRFYEELFQGGVPCLEKAFLATRCAIRDKFHQDKIWVAAMLILQDAD